MTNDGSEVARRGVLHEWLTYLFVLATVLLTVCPKTEVSQRDARLMVSVGAVLLGTLFCCRGRVLLLPTGRILLSVAVLSALWVTRHTTLPERWASSAEEAGLIFTWGSLLALAALLTMAWGVVVEGRLDLAAPGYALALFGAIAFVVVASVATEFGLAARYAAPSWLSPEMKQGNLSFQSLQFGALGLASLSDRWSPWRTRLLTVLTVVAFLYRGLSGLGGGE